MENELMVLGAHVMEEDGETHPMLIIGLTPVHVLRMVLGDPMLFVLPDDGPAVRRVMLMAANSPEQVEATLKERYCKATVQ
jgi:hypothetical protein